MQIEAVMATPFCTISYGKQKTENDDLISIQEKPIPVDKLRKHIWDENLFEITQEIWREITFK